VQDKIDLVKQQSQSLTLSLLCVFFNTRYQTLNTMSYDRNPKQVEAEKYAEQINQTRREDASALNGMTLGILLAVAIAAAATAFYFVNRRTETVPVIAPSTAPAAPEKETIIREEKTRELVPVPQATSEPNVNIIVPPSAPSPATAPSPSNNSTGSSSAQSPAPAESPSLNPSSSPSPVN
jgi:hypothetical protein